MNVFSFFGFKGCGKDTAAEMTQAYLTERGHPSTRLAFADALREEVLAAFPMLTLNDLTDRELKEENNRFAAIAYCNDEDFCRIMFDKAGRVNNYEHEPFTPRQIMQWWGTEYRRTQNPAYWLDRFTERAVQALVTGDDFLLVTDMRFLNEAMLLDVMGVTLIRVDRAEVVPPSLLGLHQSEVEQLLIEQHWCIQNDGSLNDFKFNVLETIKTGVAL